MTTKKNQQNKTTSDIKFTQKNQGSQGHSAEALVFLAWISPPQKAPTLIP